MNDSRQITAPKEQQDLLIPTGYPPDHSPAHVYLGSLAPSGRRAMAGRLRQVAGLLEHEDYPTVPWHLMRYPHVAALRSELTQLGLAPPPSI